VRGLPRIRAAGIGRLPYADDGGVRLHDFVPAAR
jgi:hypothetical protein